jgi:dTDP-4-amino-4,6-dideoxygalactose transaminase
MNGEQKPSSLIRFHEPYVTGREIEYLQQVVAGGQFAGNGRFTMRCQELLELRYGVTKVLLTHSCTAALEMSALLLNLVPGDEVILPSYTFSTTASSFLRTGARLVFCEVDPDTMMLDVSDVLGKITSRTRAIIPVHYGGIASDINGVLSVASTRGIAVVEDAAQGLESFLDGKPLGTFGRFGCISFHETKNLHAGLAGALYVNDACDIDRATFIWERGTNRQNQLKGLVDKYTWVELGSSFYPSELQAAFLLAQLEAIDRNKAERKLIHEAYVEGLQPLELSGRCRLPRVGPGRSLNFHAFFLMFPSRDDCDRVRQKLVSEGIMAYIGYVPLHSSPMGRKLGYRPEDLPVTEEMAARVLRLPFHNNLTLEQVRRICDCIALCN